VALLRPLAVTLWRGDGVGADVARWPATWEGPRPACAPTPAANKTRTTTAQTSRFMRISPLTTFGTVLSHTALNLRNPCGGGSSILLRQRMIDVQYSRRSARQRVALALDISIVVTASMPTCATRLVSAAWSFVVEIWIMPPTERRRPQHANAPRRTTGSPRQPEGTATFSGGPCAPFGCCATVLERLE
jgi:hypothetical protein